MSTTRVHTGLLAMAIAVVSLCLTGHASSWPDQAVTAPRDWSEAHPLEWTDFLAAPDAKSKGAALTAYEIQARRVCEEDGPAFRVTVRFLPNQSWIKPRQRNARILAHEQGHFDLAEVTARRLRAELALLDLGCADGNAAFTKLVADFQSRDLELQRSYDRQTMFGTGSGAQKHWEARIKSWLRDTPPR
jgi:hypothetical protein